MESRKSCFLRELKRDWAYLSYRLTLMPLQSSSDRQEMLSFLPYFTSSCRSEITYFPNIQLGIFIYLRPQNDIVDFFSP